MINEIKKRLLDDPEKIVNVLEYYDFANVRIHNNEIRCGVDDEHNSLSVRIKLLNNSNLFVKDFGRNLSYDLITYIIKIRKVEYKSVLNVIKSELGMDELYAEQSSHSIFGGIYDKIKKRSIRYSSKVYNDSVLDAYEKAYSLRFFADNIDFETQEHFNIRYDHVSQRIVIPIYNSSGDLIGVKGRANWKVSDNESKYIYLIPCAVSSTLYAYHFNYQYLTNNDIYVFEAEKSCMQCYSYGIRNCVALGSNSLSPQQCKLLMELMPKSIIFMFDEGLNKEVIQNNVSRLSAYMLMRNTNIKYWNCDNDKDIPAKSSPSDLGKEKFLEIINNEIEDVVLSKSYGTSNQTVEDYLTLKL